METKTIAENALKNKSLNGHKHPQEDEQYLPTPEYNIPERDIYRQQGYSWNIFSQFMLFALLLMSSEFSITDSLVVNDLGIGAGLSAKTEATLFAIGIALLSIAIKITYERLAESVYLKYPKAVRFVVTILSCALLTLIGLIIIGVLRFESFSIKKLEEYVYQVRDETDAKILLYKKMDSDPNTLDSVRTQGKAIEIKLIHAYDPDSKASSIEELKIKHLKKGVVRWTFILSGLLISLLAGICLGISNQIYKILYLRRKISHSRNELAILVGKFEQECRIYKEIRKLFSRYKELQKDRSFHLSERSKAISAIFHHFGMVTDKKDFHFEIQDLLLKIYKDNSLN